MYVRFLRFMYGSHLRINVEGKFITKKVEFIVSHSQIVTITLKGVKHNLTIN